MRRLISEKLQKRLLAQAEEAKTLGLTKVADQVGEAVAESEPRDESVEYTYASDELVSDVEKLLWAAAIRVQDYFDKTADAARLNDTIEHYAEDLIDSVRHTIGGAIIGPFEPAVPGEAKERTSIEVKEEDE